MADRQSSFLPTIKCSSCGNQIEISMMGEHICGGAGGSDSASTSLDKIDETFMPFNKSVHEKIGRVPPPPKVDTLAANRTYYRAGQLTPVSNSSGSLSRSGSPLTPTGRVPGRSEDYFTPKIANEYDSASPRNQPRRPGGYGGMDDVEDDMYSNNSPKKQPPSLLSRMDTIAPGPFDSKRPTAAKNALAPRSNETADAYNERPVTSNSNRSFGNNQPPRMPRKNGYGGFGPPQRSPGEYEPEPPSAISRSGTFPRENDPMEPPLRTPSAPGPRPDRLRRSSDEANERLMDGENRGRPNNDMYATRTSITRDTSRPPPPRTSLLNRPPTRDGGGPSSAIDLASEFGVGNPYHSSNVSMSSSASASSGAESRRPSQPSSQTSPARSLRSRPARKPSNTSDIDSLMQDLQSSMLSDAQSRDLPPSQSEQLPMNSGSLRNQSRPSPPPMRTPPLDGPSQREAMDRGMDRGRQWGERKDSSPRYASPERRREATRAPSRPGLRSQSRGRVPVNRGNCKACREPITGKSISSADGRLTGRYHKACFVCATCRDPFPSATFYVHDDKPYCEQHYHEKNGSLCGSCGTGIEGQYLADEAEEKFHPRCFRCSDCGQILDDGYFDVNGRRYCERDALRHVQPPPSWGPPSRTGTPSNLGPRGPPSMRGSSGLGPGLQPGGPKGYPGPGGRPGRPMGGPPNSSRLGPGPRPRMEKRMTRLGMM
ncbi:uncharacterized protein PgNI_01660 [Pyricularia grisea]|uniref:LIM zinc-binding domain-containing protein n=1 Tax=Pyricularia grisea TaxID=148305 RepID=A0A6P8BGG7_PYRGI|nr:uncharacterized protein PgNI_01660 [Pyricularia grisea]TLD15752.1 hypothetical protein PgNI_01660 [Pyricularia grisea]